MPPDDAENPPAPPDGVDPLTHNSANPLADEPTPDRRTVITLTLAAILAATAIGFVGGAFRWCLVRAEELREHLTAWAYQWPALGWLVPVALVAAGAAIGRLVVRASPRSSGSGIQDIEAVWRGEKELPGPDVVPGKFVGGLASIGTGMVLGREGPTVHMGATLGSEVGRLLRLRTPDRKVLYAAVGGAGLAVAFNAPVGGAMFAIEEVTKSFRVRIVLITLLATSIAVGCSRIVLGDAPDFRVPAIPTPPLSSLWVFALFGLLTGVVGVLYNRLTLALLLRTDRMRLSPTARAALIGGVVGLLLWFDPLLVGGGDGLTQQILDGKRLALWAVLGYLVVRFLVGPLSYAAGTPGGLFAPLLAVGALWGTFVQVGAGPLLGAVGTDALPLALVGMTAFFTATVRAPITGIVLIVEMTATTTLTVPMLTACAAAFLAARLMNDPPVYDALRERMLARERNQTR